MHAEAKRSDSCHCKGSCNPQVPGGGDTACPIGSARGRGIEGEVWATVLAVVSVGRLGRPGEQAQVVCVAGVFLVGSRRQGLYLAVSRPWGSGVGREWCKCEAWPYSN